MQINETKIIISYIIKVKACKIVVFIDNLKQTPQKGKRKKKVSNLQISAFFHNFAKKTNS